MVTASSDWTITPAPIENIPSTISSFFTCVFGVRIFPGADPVGSYSINVNNDYVPDTMSGTVSGHMYFGLWNFPMSGKVFYLYDIDNGTSGSYFATTDINGYYQIDHVPFGNYSVFYCDDTASMCSGNETFITSINLTESDPNESVDGYYRV
jgi:hypothetical protein